MKISATCLVPQYLHTPHAPPPAQPSAVSGEKKSKKFNELSQLNKLIPAYAHLIPNERLGKKQVCNIRQLSLICSVPLYGQMI